MTDIEAIEARLAAATPGPWERMTQRHQTNVVKAEGALIDSIGVTGRRLDVFIGQTSNITRRRFEADADLIAHAPADLRALLDALSFWQTRADRLAKALREAVDTIDAQTDDYAEDA